MDEPHKLMQVAQKETGLNDFGSDSFVEGLEVLVKSLRDEAKLNAMGERVIRDRIIGHLKQRLQVEDWYHRYPEIDNVAIKAPLIGLSLPRTGSTVLSFLLAQDSNARSLRRWEAAQPCPPPFTVTGSDSRIEKEIAAEQSKGFKSHVPAGATGPAECQDLMALDFKAHMFQAFAQIPSYSSWLLNADLTSTYLYERRVLKLLQWGFPERPWRLKCPTHLIFLKYLDKAFPDARFVMTHRDPTEVIPSVVDVYADIVSKFTDHTDLHYLAELNVQHWSTGMQRTLAFRDATAGHRFYDIDFRAMHEDSVAAVRGLYQWLDEPVTTEFEHNMSDWWQNNSATREPSPRLNAAALGLDLETIRPLFSRYTQRMADWTRHNNL